MVRATTGHITHDRAEYDPLGQGYLDKLLCKAHLGIADGSLFKDGMRTGELLCPDGGCCQGPESSEQPKQTQELVTRLFSLLS